MDGLIKEAVISSETIIRHLKGASYSKKRNRKFLMSLILYIVAYPGAYTGINNCHSYTTYTTNSYQTADLVIVNFLNVLSSRPTLSYCSMGNTLTWMATEQNCAMYFNSLVSSSVTVWTSERGWTQWHLLKCLYSSNFLKQLQFLGVLLSHSTLSFYFTYTFHRE